MTVIISLFIGVPGELGQKRSGPLLGAVAGLEVIIFLLYLLSAFIGHDQSYRDIMKLFNSYYASDRRHDSAGIRWDTIPIFLILGINIIVYGIVFVNNHPTQSSGSIGLFVIPAFSWNVWVPIIFDDSMKREFGIFCALNKSTLITFLIGPSLVLLNLCWHPHTLLLFSGTESVVFLMAAIVLAAASKVTERRYLHCIAYSVL